MTTVASSTDRNLCYICGRPAFCEQDKVGAIKTIVFDKTSAAKIYLCSCKCFKVYRVFAQLDPKDDVLNNPLLKILERYSEKHWHPKKKNTKMIFTPVGARKNKLKFMTKKAPLPTESKEEKKNVALKKISSTSSNFAMIYYIDENIPS